ncbi:MAG TPA: citrate transporter [Burkholderiales bacterium]|nr:citrate transporter [Burkholderiales bacterium]
MGAGTRGQCNTFGGTARKNASDGCYNRRLDRGGTPLVAYRVPAGAIALIASTPACAADGPAVLGIPVDFILFGFTLLGVALFHHHTLRVALAGLAIITLYKLAFTGFKTGPGMAGLVSHLGQEWVILTNLLCLLLGFALLSRHFEKTHLPAVLPRFLPHDWKGCFALLVIVFVLSSFLDNIAAALIGGAMAHTLFRAKVHIGYLAAIVAASNAGGSGSVVGDTTTTMMWIDGVDPLDVFEAYVAASVALVVCGIPAAIQQQRHSPILRHEHGRLHVDWTRLGIVFFILIVAIVTNVIMNVKFPEVSDRFPFIGASVVLALFVTVPLRRPDWEVLPESFKGSIFLLSLVTAATMMPVEKLPAASWHTAMGLGFVSAVFDNIPLTALALKQGGYDWGYLAYGVGFGGSMIWFGSSAGVALSNMYPEAKSVGRWLYHGWHVTLAYVVGFFALLFVMGWHPNLPHKGGVPIAAAMPTSSASPR